ncbi:MAG TPA: DUF4350 domain-containing protein [Candidatus Kapabacteria bacterium]|nr:DUF4350 domain-containing protein [Candidatus Kapabacteria bacterium]
MKRPNKFAIVLVLVFAAVVALQVTAPKEVNWTPSFIRADKNPYGCYVLHDLLGALFPGQKVETMELPLYSMLDENRSGPCIIINQEFDPDSYDIGAMLRYVERGNTVFVAADEFGRGISDTLNVHSTSSFGGASDSTELNLTNPALHRTKAYRYRPMTVDYYFASFDTASVTVLGTAGSTKPNFIRLHHGLGTIYLSTVPYAFTNYNLTDRINYRYATDALSYLPQTGAVNWDEYYKAGRQLVESPMRYVLSVEALRWALFVLLGGVTLFVIFMGRRRQRIIPIIKPLPNTTLEFVETVGQLYYQHGDHANLAEKKISYFLEYVRSTFGVNTGDRNDELYRTVAARSGVEQEKVSSLFTYIDRVRSTPKLGEADLLELSRRIEAFQAASLR